MCVDTYTHIHSIILYIMVILNDIKIHHIRIDVLRRETHVPSKINFRNHLSNLFSEKFENLFFF